jgi:Trk K+ transport system NAD-binding subunit
MVGAGVTEPRESVLVCGLGSLGVQCVLALRSYDVPVRGVDLRHPEEWQPEAELDIPFVRGDCRYGDVLRRANLLACRAVVFVTGDPHTNIEGALAARRVDSSIRIVARAAKQNLDELLSTLLGNFAAYEPDRLAASSFALAALGADVVGYFRIDDRLVRVICRSVTARDPWLRRPVDQVNGRGLVMLQHLPREREPPPEARVLPAAQVRPQVFQSYDPGRLVEEGDTLTVLANTQDPWILGGEPGLLPSADSHADRRRRRATTGRESVGLGRTAAVALGAVIVIVFALLLAMFIFPSADDSLSHADGLFTALVLMTGGTYADLFPAFHHLSNAVRFFSVLLSVLGTVAVGLVYAWLTDQLMTLRLRFAPRRPPAPRAGHIVVVGLGDAGRRAAEVLHDLGRSVAAVESDAVEEHLLPELAVVKGDGTDSTALTAAGVPEARGLVAATDNDWVNLEIALAARRLNANCEVVIRTHDPRFSENVAGVFQTTEVVCTPVIASRAFAIAALGENVLDLFRLAGRTIYVIEYRVDAGDGLDGRLLTEIAEGYAITPVLYETAGHPAHFWSPLDQAVRVHPGDRLVLLGPSESLQRIERLLFKPGTVKLSLCEARPYADRIALAALLAQRLAYPLERAQELVTSLPSTLPELLHPIHAHRLANALENSGVVVEMSCDV